LVGHEPPPGALGLGGSPVGRAADTRTRERAMSGMTGKTVLITGATNGIGLATARALAAMGARVLLHGRSAERGEAAVRAIRARTKTAEVEFLRAELSSLAQIRSLAEAIQRRAPRLDVLINNAGALNGPRTVTADGFETSFGVNHLATFVLTNLLLDRIKASAPARIVTVASEAYRGQHMHFDDLNLERGYSAFAAYGQSKLANILFTRALAKRLQGSGVTANCLHPGIVRSGFGKNNKGVGAAIFKIIGVFMLSPEDGAKTSIHLASAPEVEGVSGEYFAHCRKAQRRGQARDDAAAETLWTLSAAMTGLA
jgi:retinol dehydrogenase 12